MYVGHRLRYISAVMLVLLCGNAAVGAITLNMNNVCLLLKSGAMVAATNSCTSYYLCQGGKATQLSCSAGEYFDKDQQQCLPQAQVNCLLTSSSPCADHLVGTWTPVSGSCSGYYYCSASGPLRSNCPTGENFNPSTQSCVYASQYPCVDSKPSSPDTGDTVVDTINLCSYIKNGVFFGSASTCEGWHVCQNNVMSSGNCQTGMDFNTASAMCDYASDVSCSQVTNDPNLTGTASNYGGACTYADTINPTTLIKAASACNQFYKCNGNYYQLKQCDGGLFYDTVSRTCVSRLNARNGCDRCVGSHKTFVNAYSTTSCSGYLYCVNGVEQSTGTCPKGAYFDETAGACVQGDDPDFGCCNPQYYESSAESSTTAATTAATTASTTA